MVQPASLVNTDSRRVLRLGNTFGDKSLPAFRGKAKRFPTCYPLHTFNNYRTEIGTGLRA